MTKTRILIADDSVVYRQMLRKQLELIPEFEVVAVARNGKVAIEKIKLHQPQLVILDNDMPELNGIETLKIIRQESPHLPVIMFTSLTESGANDTVQALALGANDFVTKPGRSVRQNEAELTDFIQATFIPRIKLILAQESGSMHELPSRRKPPPVLKNQQKLSIKHILGLIEVVGIGISTGGPNALVKVLSQLPADFPVPIVIVQHMSALFTSILAERLNAESALTVLEAKHHMHLEPGYVYLAPGDYHMVVAEKRGQKLIELNQNPHENSCRPAVDVLFRALAEVYGSTVLGVIMTGMGSDGLNGCEWLHEAGAKILAQDEESSIIWGMPGYVVKAGLADQVLALEALAPEIIMRVEASR